MANRVSVSSAIRSLKQLTARLDQIERVMDHWTERFEIDWGGL
jgi:hypothetical protein